MLNRRQFEAAYEEVAATQWAEEELREVGRTGQPRIKRLALGFADERTHDHAHSEALYNQLLGLGLLEEFTPSLRQSSYGGASLDQDAARRATTVALTRDAEELLWLLDRNRMPSQ